MHIIGANVTRRRSIHLARRRTHDQQVFEYSPGSSALNLSKGAQIAAQSLTQIHLAIVAERVDRHAGFQIEFLNILIDCEDQALIGTVLALPEVEPAIRGMTFDGVHPNLLTSGR